jgi:hypothetical protein
MNVVSSSPVLTSSRQVEHSYLQPSYIMEDGQAMIGSMTFEADGYLPITETTTKNTNDNYQVPDVHVKKLDHFIRP